MIYTYVLCKRRGDNCNEPLVYTKDVAERLNCDKISHIVYEGKVYIIVTEELYNKVILKESEYHYPKIFNENDNGYKIIKYNRGVV